MRRDPNYRYGLVIRDRLINWNGIFNAYRCRKCGAPLSGKPYADPITGDIDHSLYVCDGKNEHPIREEGDVVHGVQIDWLSQQSQLTRLEVLSHIIPTDTAAHSAHTLYGDDNFGGFD